MWKIFLKEVKNPENKKKPIKKRPVKKGSAKKARSRSKTLKKKTNKEDENIKSLKILEKTLDKKLEELDTQKNNIQELVIPEEVLETNDQILDETTQTDLSVSAEKTNYDVDNQHENKLEENPENIRETDKEPVDNVVEEPVNISYELTDQEEALVQIIKKYEAEKTYGLLYGVIVDNQSGNLIYQKENRTYNISFITGFIDHYFDITGIDKNSEQLILAELEKNSFLCIQVFPEYYFGLLFNRNEVSFGQLLNVIRPKLINDYYQVIKKE